MRIDSAQFPLVWMSSDISGSDWEDDLNALIARGERFVFLTRDLPISGPNGNHEDRRRLALWLKQNRSELKGRCAGSILIVEAPSLVFALGPVVRGMSKAFGFPVSICVEASFPTEAKKLLDR